MARMGEVASGPACTGVGALGVHDRCKRTQWAPIVYTNHPQHSNQTRVYERAKRIGRGDRQH